jgi:hypothetical protein
MFDYLDYRAICLFFFVISVQLDVDHFVSLNLSRLI